MPELPEVETVRRALAASVPGRTIARVSVSRFRLRGASMASLPGRLRGRTILHVSRTGKYLLFALDQGLTLLSHLGMSGRWLFHAAAPAERLAHEHLRLTFTDGSVLRFEDPRRFGIARAVVTARLSRDPALAILGPDPVAEPPTAERLARLARGMKVRVKEFLLDQRRIAGIGNIYASEILHRARVHPGRRAGTITRVEWDAIAGETVAVLHEAIERMGTTFSLYRTPRNEPGQYGERLLVYDRAGEPCRPWGAANRRIVQGARSTFFCPSCQPSGRRPTPGAPRRRAGRRPPPAAPRSRLAGSTRRPVARSRRARSGSGGPSRGAEAGDESGGRRISRKL
jgi:formamidopyrimidine-DNA glycosylase